MKFFQIIVLVLIALMSGHGYFVPVYKANYLPRFISKPLEGKKAN